jgi:hypothetical protein
VIETLLLSTVLPAVVFGVALALAFWTPFYRRAPCVTLALLGLVAAACFAGGHLVLSGWPNGAWTQAVAFLLWLSLFGWLAEVISQRHRLLEMLCVVALVVGMVWVLSLPARTSGTTDDVQLMTVACLALIPLFSHICRGSQGAQWTRAVWIVTGALIAGALTLAGSALLGQITGILVALWCAYFVFALLSGSAREQLPGHLMLLVVTVAMLVLGHFLLDIPKRSLIAFGLALTLAPWLQAQFRRGWVPLVFATLVLIGLNGAALYWVYAENQ